MSSCCCGKGFYQALIYIGEGFQSILLLAMRLFWGYWFFQSGLGKLKNISSVVEFFNSLGIPFPEINAYIAGSIECIGGLLLLIGFASRLVSIPLAVVMIVALLTAHVGAVKTIFSDPQSFIGQSPFNYLLTALIVFAFGPGKISVDYLIEKLCCQKRNNQDLQLPL
jgi:putative oxidoreductase